ncbi:MAG: hypothetical protein ACETV1_05310 [Candidatus Bathyarchaeia archaeon]
MTLDRFLPPTAKSKQAPGISDKEKCADCGNELSPKEMTYKLSIRGKEKKYCPGCAKRILRPQENSELDL